MGAFNKFFAAIIILMQFFVLSQKEYFPTNSGVKVVNEPYKAFVNATIVVNSEKTIKNGTLIFRDGKIIDVGSGIGPLTLAPVLFAVLTISPVD